MGQQTQNTNSSQASNGTTSSNFSTNPGYAPQASFLSSVFAGLPGAMGTSASWLPQQQGLASLEANAGNGAAGNASTLTGAGTTAATNGYTGANSALTSLLGFNPSSTNNTSGVAAAAQQYLDNSNIPAQVKQAMESANQEARDVTLPGINQSMTDTGNQDSSRNGIAQGLVQRGLAENAQNMTAALEGQAYGTGAQLGENMLAANNASSMGALAAALSGGTGLGTSGAIGSTEGTNNAATAFNTLGQGGLNYGVTSPYSYLAPAMGIGGTTNWGTTGSTTGTNQSTGTGTSTTTSNPSTLSMIGSILGMAGSLF